MTFNLKLGAQQEQIMEFFFFDFTWERFGKWSRMKWEEEESCFEQLLDIYTSAQLTWNFHWIVIHQGFARTYGHALADFREGQKVHETIRRQILESNNFWDHKRKKKIEVKGLIEERFKGAATEVRGVLQCLIKIADT